MKKLLLTLIFAVPYLLIAGQKYDLKFFNTLDIVKQVRIEVVDYQFLDEIYYLKGKPLLGNRGIYEFFLTKNLKQLIIGNAFNVKDQSPIKFKVRQFSKKVKENEAITFGTGKKNVYLFTDPQCQYCKPLLKRLVTLGDKYTFKIFLFPLIRIHSESIPMIKYILSSKTEKGKFDRLIEIANESKVYKLHKMTVEENKKLDKFIKKQLSIGESIDIQGTPTVLDVDGYPLNI